MSTTAPWRSRITGSGEEAPGQLLANPANWRLHPKAQQDALAGALDQVGWVQQVMVNRRTGFDVDGHARVALALSRDEPTVPVLYVDLDPDEEALVVATLAPIGALAGRDDEKLRDLLAGITVDDTALLALSSWRTRAPRRAGEMELGGARRALEWILELVASSGCRVEFSGHAVRPACAGLEVASKAGGQGASSGSIGQSEKE